MIYFQAGAHNAIGFSVSLNLYISFTFQHLSHNQTPDNKNNALLRKVFNKLSWICIWLNQFNNENEWWFSYCSGCALVWCDSVRYQEGGRNVNRHTENDQRKVIFIELSNLFGTYCAFNFYYLISSSHTHTHSHKYIYIFLYMYIDSQLFNRIATFGYVSFRSHFWWNSFI